MLKTIYDDQKEKQQNSGSYDDLGVHPERREAETDDLEKSYGLPAAKEPDYSKSSSPDQIKEAEQGGGFYKPEGGGKEDKDLQKHDNQIGEGFKDDDKPGRLRRIGSKIANLSPRKKLLGGGAIGTLVGVLGFLTIIQAPAELLHLDAALGKHEKAHTIIINSRINKMLRRSLLRHSDDRLLLARTRLGFVQNKVFGGMLDRLERQGISFTETTGPITANSRPTVIFDLPADSPLRGRTATITKLNIAREFGIDPSKLDGVIGNNDAPIIIRQLDLTTAELDGLKKGLARRAGGGSVTKLNPRGAVAINKRLFRKVLRLPGLFHPISRASEAAGRRADSFVLARRERKKADAERSRKSTEVDQRKNTARSDLRRNAGTNVMRTAGAAVAVQGVMCMIKDIAGIVPNVYYSTVVMPSMIRAIQAQSSASQLMSGEDFTIEQIGDIKADFRDANGGSIWGAKSLDALTYGGGGRGTDIDIGARSAFTTTGGSIAGLTAALGYDDVVGTEVSDSVAGWACSTPARIGGLVVGIGITAAGVAGGVVSGGTTTAGAVARVGAQAVLAATISYTVSRILGEFVDGQVRGKVADVCGVEFDSGESGDAEDIEVLNAEAFGNCLAYAARMSSNINASSMGGVPISSSEELALLDQVNKREIAEFREKGLFKRLFSLREERSLAMSILQPSAESGIMNNNLSSVASSLLKPPTKMIAGLFSNLSPTAHAESVAYDWGFPLVSMPSHIIDDPRYSDPIENANWVADNIENLDEDKVEKCFGVEIVGHDDQLRTVPLDKEINPLSDEYNDKNCGDLSSPNWVRTALFVMDDSIARSMDCYDGSSDSCREIGVGDLSAGAQPGTSPISGQIGGQLENVSCPDNLVSHASQAGYYQMPATAPNGEYSVYSVPSKRWGSKNLICIIHSVGLAYNDAMQGKSKLRVGNLNTPYNQPSVSHRWGVAVDLSASGEIQAANNTGTYSKDATILLGKLFVDSGAIKNIWWCPPSDDNSIEEIKNYAVSKGSPLNIKCISGHANHFHVDLKDEYKLQLYSP